MASVQTYENHRRWLPPIHFFAIPVLLVNALNAIRHLYLDPSRSTAFAVLVAAALLVLSVYSRVQALTVQDRVIRLEMRLRLQSLLPADLYARFDDLTVRQLTGLRFASDGEMTELVRTTLKEHTEEGEDQEVDPPGGAGSLKALTLLVPAARRRSLGGSEPK